MFESLYASSWQHPGIAFFAAATFALVRARRQSFVAAWTTIFLLAIAADAMTTGGFAPIPKGSLLERNLGITFVILGDFRFFLLIQAFVLTRAVPHGLGPPKAWLWATVLAFVVPVASLVHQRVMPDWFTNGRHVFLGYELMMLAFVGVLRLAFLPRWLDRMNRVDGVQLAGRSPGRSDGGKPTSEAGWHESRDELRIWLLRVTAFVLVQYGLWVSADVIILSGIEAGYLLRIVPNALYYGAFVPFVFLSAPGSARAT